MRAPQTFLIHTRSLPVVTCRILVGSSSGACCLRAPLSTGWAILDRKVRSRNVVVLFVPRCFYLLTAHRYVRLNVPELLACVCLALVSLICETGLGRTQFRPNQCILADVGKNFCTRSKLTQPRRSAAEQRSARKRKSAL